MSFLFLAEFLKNQEQLFGEISYFSKEEPKLEGIFYICLFCFILIMGISSKGKGVVYIIDYAALIVSYAFIFSTKFFEVELIEKIKGYILIVSGGLFWITGIFKLFNSLIIGTIPLFEPTD